MASLPDIIEAIYADLDSTAIDYVIQEFLDEPANGFFEYEEVYADDGTTIVAIVPTVPSLTVEEWKDLYYEGIIAQQKRSQNELVITDSNSPQYPVPDFESLTNRVFDSGGLSYGNTDWVKFEFDQTLNTQVVGVWCDSNAGQVYFSYSKNNSDWTFLKAEADHTTNSNQLLLEATDEADAQTNYWELIIDSGQINQAKFPNGVRSKYCRIHFLNTVTVYELKFENYIIPGQLVVDYLSALSADVGLLTAGVIQSANFDDGGTKLDLDNDVFTVYDDQGNLRVKLGKLT